MGTDGRNCFTKLPPVCTSSSLVLCNLTDWLAVVAGGATVTGDHVPRPMADGEWATRARAKQSREAAREADRRLRIEWADKLWLAQNHPCDDAILAWLSEYRSDASKIGASRWNLETLPLLVEKQSQLRKHAEFQEVLQRASISQQTLTVEQVLSEAGGFPQIPQDQPVEITNAAQPTRGSSRARRADAGKRQPSRKKN